MQLNLPALFLSLPQCSLKEVAKAEYHPTFGKNEVNVKAEVRKVHKHYRVVLRRVKTILVQLFNAVLKNPEMESFPDLCAILNNENNNDNKTSNPFDDVQLVCQNFQNDFIRPSSGRPRDLLLVLDSSGSIKPEDFKAMKDGVKLLIDSLCGGFGMSDTNNRLSIIQFSTDSRGVYTFNHDQDAETLKNVVDLLHPMNGYTCTGTALELGHLAYDPRYGARDFAIHDTLIITDGQSNCGPDLLQSSLFLQQRSNVYALAIGLGNNADAAVEIQSVVSNQDPRHLFSLANFKDFQSMAEQVKAQSDPEKCQEIAVN
nr:hypothetical protein BaRGS_013720 [Batillaria attramentaria]